MFDTKIYFILCTSLINKYVKALGKNPCLSDPCINGGLCRDLSQKFRCGYDGNCYECVCSEYFHGDHCQFESFFSQVNKTTTMSSLVLFGIIGFFALGVCYILTRFFNTIRRKLGSNRINNREISINPLIIISEQNNGPINNLSLNTITDDKPPTYEQVMNCQST
ncbi:unnamed protein product [Brachionus calyciflorus]|uniref:EGF-like domain-containing protein n=1 Tax=Brachionus calyciflorus TaxID=104777 RepID=A0A814EM24_9BILA|nr:unnamed protein product [Brachionus calyciflorus]